MEEREFIVRSCYDHRAMVNLCRAQRKVLKRKRSLALRIFIWLMVTIYTLSQLLLLWIGAFLVDKPFVLSLIAVLVMLSIMFLEDHLNAWIASWMLLPGTKDAETSFSEENYTATTGAAVTEWQYGNIRTIVESPEYFVLFLSKRHGQVFPKSGFLRGSPEGFRAFIGEKTGLPIRRVK